jgi:hypothetical protein
MHNIMPSFGGMGGGLYFIVIATSSIVILFLYVLELFCYCENTSFCKLVCFVFVEVCAVFME